MSEDTCTWPGSDSLYLRYHDEEWGVPEYDGRALWEKLMLDGFQAGLSWITILRKREAFQAAFDRFDPVKVAAFGEEDVTRLLANSGIVRHRGKIEAAVRGAKAWQEIEAGEGFANWMWRYVDGLPITNRWRSMAEIPAATPLSERISKDLKKAGFSFCGPTIVYAFMQAVGMVNDHLVACPRHRAVAKLASRSNS